MSVVNEVPLQDLWKGLLYHNIGSIHDTFKVGIWGKCEKLLQLNTRSIQLTTLEALYITT